MNRLSNKLILTTMLDFIAGFAILFIFKFISNYTLSPWNFVLFLLFITLEIGLALLIYYIILPFAKKQALLNNYDYIIERNSSMNNEDAVWNLISLICILSYLCIRIYYFMIHKIEIMPIHLLTVLPVCLLVIFNLVKNCVNLPVETPVLSGDKPVRVETNEPKVIILDSGMYLLKSDRKKQYTWFTKGGSVVISDCSEAKVYRALTVNEDLDIGDTVTGVFSLRKKYAILFPRDHTILYYNIKELDTKNDISEELNRGDEIVQRGNITNFFKASSNIYKIVSYKTVSSEESISKEDYGIYVLPYNCAIYNCDKNEWLKLGMKYDGSDSYINTEEGNLLIKISSDVYLIVEIVDLTMRSENESIILESSDIGCYKCERISTSTIRNYYYYSNDKQIWLNSEKNVKELEVIDDFLYLYKIMKYSLTIVNRRDISRKSMITGLEGLYYISSEKNRATVFKADSGLIAYRHIDNKYNRYDTSSGVILVKPTDSFLFIESGREIYRISKHQVTINLGMTIKTELTMLISIAAAENLPEEINASSTITINNLRGYIEGDTNKEDLVNYCIDLVLKSIENSSQIVSRITQIKNEIDNVLPTDEKLLSMTQEDINNIKILLVDVETKLRGISSEVLKEIGLSVSTLNDSIFSITPSFTNASIIVELIENLIKQYKEISDNIKPNITDVSQIILEMIKVGRPDSVASFMNSIQRHNADLELLDDKIVNNYSNCQFIKNNFELSREEVLKDYEQYKNNKEVVSFADYLALQGIESISNSTSTIGE